MNEFYLNIFSEKEKEFQELIKTIKEILYDISHPLWIPPFKDDNIFANNPKYNNFNIIDSQIRIPFPLCEKLHKICDKYKELSHIYHLGIYTIEINHDKALDDCSIKIFPESMYKNEGRILDIFVENRYKWEPTYIVSIIKSLDNNDGQILFIVPKEVTSVLDIQERYNSIKELYLDKIV